MRQKPQILARLQRVEGLLTDLAPIRRRRLLAGLRRRVGRPGLAEQPECVKRGQQRRIFEVVPARPIGIDRLEQVLPALQSRTHARTPRPASAGFFRCQPPMSQFAAPPPGPRRVPTETLSIYLRKW